MVSENGVFWLTCEVTQSIGFPSYDIQNRASIHVQNISKQQFYCLSVIICLECIKITFKNVKIVWFWYISCPVCTAVSNTKLP